MHFQDIAVELDEAQYIKSDVVRGTVVMQAWFGGTTVNVFTVNDGGAEEVTMWSLHDCRGGAPEQSEVEMHMEMHLENWREEGWC